MEIAGILEHDIHLFSNDFTSHTNLYKCVQHSTFFLCVLNVSIFSSSMLSLVPDWPLPLLLNILQPWVVFHINVNNQPGIPCGIRLHLAKVVQKFHKLEIPLFPSFLMTESFKISSICWKKISILDGQHI